MNIKVYLIPKVVTYKGEVAIQKATEKDMYEPGIHLFNPTEQEIKNAISEAHNDGANVIWIHGKKRLRA